MNPYPYVLNNPLKYVDPLGLSPMLSEADLDDGIRAHLENIRIRAGLEPEISINEIMKYNALGRFVNNSSQIGCVEGMSETEPVEIWDEITAKRIDSLHPLIREEVNDFIIKAQEEGINLRITFGLRTFDEQSALYNKGRDENGNTVDKSKIVTNAKAGQSYHNYGLAFDIVEIKDGKAIWSNDNWDKIGEIGKGFGFEWGGDWTSFIDRPHFENDFGLHHSKLLEMYNNGDVDDNGYVIINK